MRKGPYLSPDNGLAPVNSVSLKEQRNHPESCYKESWSSESLGWNLRCCRPLGDADAAGLR